MDTIIKRIGGFDYEIGPIMTSEALVCFWRLQQLTYAPMIAACKAAAGLQALELSVSLAKETAFAFDTADWRDGGDLWPMIQCVHVIKATGKFPLAKIYETHFQRKLGDLRTLMRAVEEHNFGDFTEAFGVEMQQMTVKAIGNIWQPKSAGETATADAT